MYKSYRFIDNNTNVESVFKELPQSHITEGMKKTALSKNGFLIANIHNASYEMCKLAVQQNGAALSVCPKQLIDSDLCKIAVAQDGSALSACPAELVDHELCKLAVSQNGLVLEIAIKQEQCTVVLYELCKIAVVQNGLALIHCPVDVIDYELCETAVSQNGLALKHCPRVFTDDRLDVILFAICNDYRSIQYVNEHHKYYTMLCKEALRINGHSLCYIMKDVINLKMILVALNNHNGNIMDIVKHKNFVSLVEKLNVKERTKVYELAVGMCSAVVFHVPHDLNLALTSPLDDVMLYGKFAVYNYNMDSKRFAQIGNHSHKMTIQEYEQLLIKWYPERLDMFRKTYPNYINKKNEKEEKPVDFKVRPVVKGDCYKNFEESYVVYPDKCINSQVPRHMYDTSISNRCECKTHHSFGAAHDGYETEDQPDLDKREQHDNTDKTRIMCNGYDGTHSGTKWCKNVSSLLTCTGEMIHACHCPSYSKCKTNVLNNVVRHLQPRTKLVCSNVAVDPIRRDIDELIFEKASTSDIGGVVDISKPSTYGECLENYMEKDPTRMVVYGIHMNMLL
jgi:hypothetical protein